MSTPHQAPRPEKRQFSIGAGIAVGLIWLSATGFGTAVVLWMMSQAKANDWSSGDLICMLIVLMIPFSIAGAATQAISKS